MLEAVIFDMDGVIFDSEALVISTWKQVADKYGISGIEDTCMECLGTNSEATVRIFQKNYGKDFPYAVYKKEMAELFHEQAAGGKLPKKKGVIELLEYLHYRDIKVGLATSTREEVVKKELSEGGLFEYFDEIVCGDMVKRSKPEPDIYLEACKRLQVSPENCYGKKTHIMEYVLLKVPECMRSWFRILQTPQKKWKNLQSVFCRRFLK